MMDDQEHVFIRRHVNVYIYRFCFRVLHTDNLRIHTLELTIHHHNYGQRDFHT
jgi:hypothetical protein